MSKKQIKFDRDIELPDWADEVTPADEVMKKFYAPTGTFKRGPLASPDFFPAVPSVSTSNQAEDDQSPQAEWDQQIEIKPQAAELPLPHPLEPQETPTAQPISVVPPSEQTHTIETAPATSLKPEDEPTSDTNFADADASAHQSSDESTSHISDVSAPASFEEFAGKWKTYLYPGQVAVMRLLYETTYALGSDECFTSYSQIAKATKMSRRNCIYVMNTLVVRGFVERLEIRNDINGKGIRFRVHPEPQA